ncbi:MAG: Ig-like domain-containing protein, partial [Candidatus Margulisiibacteriota bacterium]
SNYSFKTKSRNPNGDNPESVLSTGGSSGDNAPVLNDGSTGNTLLPMVQATNGSGYVTLTFKIKDLDLNNCSAVDGSFEYQINGGAWSAISDASVTGTKTGLSSAADFNGTTHVLTWESKNQIDNAVSSNVKVRFNVNDGTLNSADGTSPALAQIDNLNPAKLATTEVTTRPSAGDTTVTLEATFTETNPNTNTFYVAINGGAYSSGTSGEGGTATPAAKATAVGATLDGNDYVTGVKCVHVDAYGNVGTNEGLSPATAGVKPYTPAAPTVNNPTATTVDVIVNKNASEVDGLAYAIYETTQGEYVQANGTLGVSPVWQTTTVWGTVTVTGLASPVSTYVFKTKSRNPNGDNPESTLSAGGSSGNTAPILNNGSTDNTLFALAQATDGSGKVAVTFRIKDVESNTCSAVDGSFEYQINAGTWTVVPDASITGTKTGLSAAVDYNGTTHVLTWESKDQINNTVSSNVKIRFNVNDGVLDSSNGTSPALTQVDNLNPATLASTKVTQPSGGDTTATLEASFTETNPNTNTFYVAINGGTYSSGTAGDSGTAAPAAKATAVGATLKGNDYISGAKCVHVDAYGNVGTNESTTTIYVKPYTPPSPEVGTGSITVRPKEHTAEVTGLEYAIYETSTAKYVQADGTLGLSSVWQTTTLWGTKEIIGLSTPYTQYVFKTKSRNSIDTTHAASSESALSAGTSISGGSAPTVESYIPPNGAIGAAITELISVVFNKEMDHASVARAFSLTAIRDKNGDATTEAVAGALSWSGTTLTFTPSSNLKYNYQYEVGISTEATDASGNSLAAATTYRFLTIINNSQMNTVVAADGKTKVEISPNSMPSDSAYYININLDPMDHPTAVNPATITAANAKAIQQHIDEHYPLVKTLTEMTLFRLGASSLAGGGTIETRNFITPVTITMPYTDLTGDGIVDESSVGAGVKAENLIIYRLDQTNALWVRVPTSVVNVSRKVVTATVPSLAVFVLMSTPASGLESVYAFPVPFVPRDGHTRITFTNLMSTCTIRIYTISGSLVKTIQETDGDGQANWDVKNDSGQDVVSGVYIFHVKSGDQTKVGKIAIIR